MLINTKWLLEYLEPQCTHEEILRIVPKVGLEVEQLHDLRAELKDVRVGFIREKAPLAGAAGLYACQIEVERGRVVPVVCASEHEVQVGWGVPVALAGTKLPGGRAIAAGGVHGARSEGMICLDGEMGLLATGSGMQVFHDEATLGQPLPSVMRIEEYLVELNVLPNRPDCLGMIGIAREVAAAGGMKLRYPGVAAAGAARSPLKAPVSVELLEPKLCPRYLCHLIRGVKVGASPHWLKSRLLAIGSRPINNVVDITNFILYEWGQPLHAFDYDRLEGRRIVVRTMRPDETMELLSGKVIDGKEAPLVIADAKRPVALAGVMGGRATETNAATVNVLLEAAHFDPVNIRKTVKKIDIGLETRGTASSYRFERGTDPNRMITGALERASALIVELCGGRLDGPATDEYPVKREPRVFNMSSQLCSSYLGTPVDDQTIRGALERLEMEVAADLSVKAPTWRVDVNDPVVLIEDVARQISYDIIPTQPGAGSPTIGVRCEMDRLRQAVAQHLVAAGYLEARNAPLETPEASAVFGPQACADQIRISNPANRDMSVVRCSLLPGLLRSGERNLHRGWTSVRLFEIDRVFRHEKNEPQDRWMVTGIAGGAVREQDWRAGGARLEFHDIKGDVENLLESVGVRQPKFRPIDAQPFVPGAVAEIVADEVRLGRLGELRQGVIDTGKMQFRLFSFEMDLGAMIKWFIDVPRARPLARMPAVMRDLAIVVRAEAIFDQIDQEIRSSAGPELEAVELMDVYQGSQIPAGHKSLAFHLVLRDPKRTMTADEASVIVNRVVGRLQERFGAQLRV